MSSDQKINVGVIGYGLSAKVFHIPFIQALPDVYNLYAVVQRSPKPDDDASKDHPGIKSYRSADELFADEAVDLVVLSTIPSTHYDFTKSALESGKHVVVEKPFVPTSTEARELTQLAKDKGKVLAVYQNRRWDQDFVTLKQILEAGKLGDIVEFETHFDRYSPNALPKTSWKAAGNAPAQGAVFDLGTHLLDQVYHLFGPPKSVTAFVQVQRLGLTAADAPPDAFTIILRYGNAEKEMLVTAKSSMISAQEEQLRYWVRGSKGAFKKYHLDVQEPQLLSGVTLKDEKFGVEPTSSHGTLTVAKDGGMETGVYPSVEPPTYVEYFRILGDALKGKGKVPVSGDDATEVLKIIEMAIESSKTGKTIEW